MTQDKDRIRHDRSALENALRDAGAVLRGKAIKCPFHDDQHPSGNVYEKDGVWRFKCQTASCGFCGDVFDVRARISGRPVEEQLRELSNHGSPSANHPTPRETAPRVFRSIDALKAAVAGLESAFVYTNPTTHKPDMIVLRSLGSDGRKYFIQCRPEVEGFAMKAPEKPWPLYNRTRVAAAPTVVVVEGEKCVHIAQGAGHVATTSPGGAGKAGCADWRPLAGKTVYLWPDNDAPDPKTGTRAGIAHMQQVAAILEKLEPAPKVSWIDPDALGLPPKGDIEQYLELYGGSTPEARHNAIKCALELAEPMGAAREVGSLIEDAISGRRAAVSWPWPAITQSARALLPGTVTVLCGDPGATKSYMLLEAGTYWHRAGIKVAIYELEDDRAYHLQRALAQVEQRSDLVDDGWIKKNPDEARAAFDRRRDFLDGFGRCLTVAPDKQVSLDELAEWVAQQARAGCRIIACDPVTMAAVSDRPWIDDLAFIVKVKTLARAYGFSLILVTHPRKGKRVGVGLDDLAGGSAYQRFSQSVIWIERHDRPKQVRCMADYGAFLTEINRTVRLLKTRNGRGAGAAIGFNFDGKSLCLAEQGVIVRKAANAESEPAEVQHDDE